jgi:phosphopantetheinyl transferase
MRLIFLAMPENSGFTSPFLPQANCLSWSGIEGLRSACLGMALRDIEPFVSPGDHLFTPREAARASRMGSRRLRGFTAARVALKTLARQLGLVEESRPDWTIETLGPDDGRPCLAERGIYCAASHSSRFVVAVGHKRPIGVDIETISSKVMRIRHLFLSPTEQNLISLSDLGPERTVTRLWTTKEAAAKALGLQLLEAFREVEVVMLGKNEGEIRYQEKTFLVKHAEGNGHVITLMIGAPRMPG